MLHFERRHPLSSIRLAELFGPEGEDRGVMARRDGSRVLLRSRRTGPDRILDSFEMPTGRPLDRIHFRIGPEGFSEHARYDRAGGPNLLGAPIRLPPVLRVGQVVRPIEGLPLEVELAFAGEAALELSGRQALRRVALLRATQGETRLEQWLVAGVGEAAQGIRGQPLSRWLVAWSGPGGPPSWRSW